jgi:hypothetical protein
MSLAQALIRMGQRVLRVFPTGSNPYDIQAADNEPERCTYGFGINALNLAATPTDIFFIRGGAGKVTRIKSIIINGNSASLAAYPLQLIRRSTANTGASNAITALQHDTSDPAPVSTVGTYTTNPSALGTQVGGFHMGRFIAASASNLDRMSADYAWRNDKALILNGANEWIVGNMAGAALAGATTVDIDITLCEE